MDFCFGGQPSMLCLGGGSMRSRRSPAREKQQIYVQLEQGLTGYISANEPILPAEREDPFVKKSFFGCSL